VPGVTAVTISGSGFGAQQGTGQVWLGTANGVVQSWSDTQVVAQVAAGAASGNAQVLQGGVMSNAVPFTVNTPQLASISPISGLSGTQVTFTGSGFGSLQGTGTVWLGSTAGQVVSWSDTTVVATVAPSALSGIARIQQNGVLTNALYFTVPVTGGNTLVPSLLNMVVGDTRTIQALNSASLPVTGLTWVSSDPTIVNLSPDDPPILTALAAGHVTITAGTASADVTVSTALPLGTVIWSNPGDGSGVQSIVPAVPSTSGVADVFAFQADGTVAAITSDGTTAWTANAGGGMPDFQGGLVVVGQSSIYKLDGITGQPYPAYTVGGTTSLGAYGGSLVAVHPDGTIFAVQQNFDRASYSEWDSVIGIDPTTGAQKFSVDLDSWPGFVWGIMIAGDGNAYVAYSSREYGPPGSNREYDQLKLLQVNSSGASTSMDVYDWEGGSDDITDPGVSMITNADQGVLLTWSGGAGGMAVTAGASVSLVSKPQVPGGGQVFPVLQAQDGSFVGVTEDQNTYNNDMVAFDATGNARWIVPNDTPQIATADGGVIGQSGITYDQAGNATGMIANMPTYSWTGSAYLDGPTTQVLAPPLYLALGFWSLFGGNNSGTGAAVNQQWFPPLASCTDNGGNCQGQPLGPRDFLWNAKQDLAGQLAHDQACMTAANTFVFNKVQYGGFLGFFKSPINGSQFDLYIQNTQLFYNGPKSTLDYAVAKCGIPRQFNCNGVDPPQTVGQQFDSNETALTVTPGMPLMSFWQPNFTPPATVNGTVENEGFGVGINPSNYGVNIFNESNLFHEALHGMTGLDDFTIQGDLMGSAQQGAPSVNISIFIKDNVLRTQAWRRSFYG